MRNIRRFNMNIIVLIKQVPQAQEIRIDARTGILIREGAPCVINPCDLSGLTEGIRLRQISGGRVTVVSMGPPQAIDALQEAIAIGADEGILLTDSAFAGADTLATAYTLGRCLEKLGAYDLIICGAFATDGDTGQVGPQVAEYLGIPQVTFVRKVEIIENRIIAEKETSFGCERRECAMPALITVLKEVGKPGYPPIERIIHACEKADIRIWNAADIGALADRVGLSGSPTQVRKTFAPDCKRGGEILSGDRETVVRLLVEKLRGKKII